MLTVTIGNSSNELHLCKAGCLNNHFWYLQGLKVYLIKDTILYLFTVEALINRQINNKW